MIVGSLCTMMCLNCTTLNLCKEYQRVWMMMICYPSLNQIFSSWMIWCSKPAQIRSFKGCLRSTSITAILALLVQNLFVQGKSSRTISLNANYMILFKNPRDVNQVAMLGRQMYTNTKYFMECYHDAVNQPFGYIMIDYKAKTPEQYRLRTGLLSDRQVVYIPKKRRRTWSNHHVRQTL